MNEYTVDLDVPRRVSVAQIIQAALDAGVRTIHLSENGEVFLSVTFDEAEKPSDRPYDIVLVPERKEPG